VNGTTFPAVAALAVAGALVVAAALAAVALLLEPEFAIA
jgi:hypothetical protein